MNNHTTLIYSGGLDSTVLLYWLLDKHNTVTALSFDYGQRHRREIDAAKTVTELLNVEHHVLTLPKLPGSVLTESGTMPHGHYAEESMKQTVVPNRNMVMLAHAASFAIANKHGAVAYGCHAGDHTIYPDCRFAFVEAMRNAFRLCDWTMVDLLAPFVYYDKREIVCIGRRLGVPFEITWTCYEGGEAPCGKCGSCVEREEAMR
jgi:7-cyano-7-deazaguanine synthase